MNTNKCNKLFCQAYEKLSLDDKVLVFNVYAQNSHCTHDFYFDAKIYVNDDYFLNKNSILHQLQ